MSNRARLLRIPLMLLALAVACDDDDDPAGPDPNETGSLSQAEAATLAAAITASGALDPETAPVVALALAEIREHGTVTFALPGVRNANLQSALRRIGGDYDAVGFQAVITMTVGGDPLPPTVATGIFAWTGIDPVGGTVDEFLIAVAAEEGPSAPPASGSAAVAVDGDAEVTYYEDATGSAYEGTAGTFTWSDAAFSGSSGDCSTTIGDEDVDCSFLEGDLSGSLGFDAALVFGTGDPTLSVASTSFDLPALRFTITIASNPAQ